MSNILYGQTALKDFLSTLEGREAISRVLNNLKCIKMRWSYFLLQKEPTSLDWILFFCCLPSKLLSRILRASHRDLNHGSLKMFYFSFVLWMNVSAGFWQTLAAIAGIDIETCFPALNLTVWELQLDYKNSISALILKDKWPGLGSMFRVACGI